MDKAEILSPFARFYDGFQALATAELTGLDARHRLPCGTLRELADELSRFLYATRFLEGAEWQEARALAFEIRDQLGELRSPLTAATWEDMQSRFAGYLGRVAKLWFWLQALPDASTSSEDRADAPGDRAAFVPSVVDMAILTYLAETPCGDGTQASIVAGSGYARTCVQERLELLRQAGFVATPEGRTKRGSVITQAGREALRA